MKPISLPPCLLIPFRIRTIRTYIRTSVICPALRRMRQMTTSEKFVVKKVARGVTSSGDGVSTTSCLLGMAPRPKSLASQQHQQVLGRCRESANLAQLSWQHRSGQLRHATNERSPAAHVRLEPFGRRGVQESSRNQRLRK
jgi:hypothetical protein